MQLSDGFIKVDNAMQVDIVSSLPPAFSSLPLLDQKTYKGVPKTISLPSFSDPDGQIVKVSAFLNTVDLLPAFITL